MALLIEDEDVEREIERLASDLKVSPVEVVRRVILDRVTRDHVVPPVGPEVVAQRMKAIRDAQDWFAAHHDPKDLRTSNDVIGYNEHGLFDR
jgi:hypothetical protein